MQSPSDVLYTRKADLWIYCRSVEDRRHFLEKRNNSPLSIEASFCESHPVANNALTLLLLLAMKSFFFQLVTVSMDSEGDKFE